MKRGCFGFLLMVLLLLPFAASAQGPKLVVEGAEFSFGQIFQGTKVEHTFRFRNAGDAPLNVEKVRSSCGCTAALASATTIPPGGTGEIRTAFDSARFKGMVAKTVYLYVNDPLQPVVQLHLRGTVNPEFLLEPEQIDLGTLVPGAVTTARITLTNKGEQEASFPSLETTGPELQAEFADRRLLPGKSAQLTVKATPGEGKARLSGYVLIKTSSPRIPELRIPVYGNIAQNPAAR